MSKEIIILAADPGTANFGYTVLKATIRENLRPTKLQVLQFGRINCTLREMTGSLSMNARTYSASIKYLIDKFDVDACIMERFQTRGLGGPTIELVSTMIGIATSICLERELPIKAIIASQWKIAAKRVGVELEDIYSAHKEAEGVSPHEVDSLFIGIYGLHLMSNCKPYDPVFSQYNDKILLMNSKRVMLGEPVRRKAKRR